MTDKPQRFKILRDADPEELAREISEHLNGIEHVDEDGDKTTFVYTLHGETRVIETPLNLDTVVRTDRWYEQNVIVMGVTSFVERVKVEESASEAIQ